MNMPVHLKRMSHSVICTPWVSSKAYGVRYANAAECVGYHTDQLTYLGPHPTIASISLGCEREVHPQKSIQINLEFRIRKIEPGVKNADTASAPIGIHLPHNSLLSTSSHHLLQRLIESNALNDARILETFNSPRHSPHTAPPRRNIPLKHHLPALPRVLLPPVYPRV
jgi:2OG-Fe(II) oxygenase superfamily